jgi:hypothetical protein
LSPVGPSRPMADRVGNYFHKNASRAATRKIEILYI